MRGAFSLRPGMCDSESMHVDALLVNVSNPESILGLDSALPLESLGIATLANVLAAQGNSVAVCDADDQCLDFETLQETVLGCRAAMLGFTTYQANMAQVLSLASAYKSRYPQSTVCLGGYQATFCAPEILSGEPYVDIVVTGRAESVINNILDRARHGLPTRGIVPGARGHSESLFSPLSRWAFRDRERTRKKGGASLVSSEGCLANCSFCASPQFERLQSGPRWRGRPLDDLMAEIRWLHDELDVSHFHFHDPDFLGMHQSMRDRALEIARALCSLPYDLHVRFTAQARAVACEGDDYWHTWRQAGLERVFIGFESGEDRQLRRFRKWSRRSDNRESILKLRRQGIAVQTGFIMFTPDTAVEDILESIAFLKEIGQAHSFKYFSTPLRIYPGTAEFDRLETAGRLQYAKKYLDITYGFSCPVVAEIVRNCVRVRGEADALDRLLYDLEFGISGNWSTIQTPFGPLGLQAARPLYSMLRGIRERQNLECFRKAIEGDACQAFDAFLEGDRKILAQAKEIVHAGFPKNMATSDAV